MEACFVFVYGTLRKAAAHPNHQRLLPATFVGSGSFQGKLFDLGNYPGAMLSDDPAHIVQGDVYLLHEPVPTLARLDEYEACSDADPLPHEYVRTMVPIRLESSKTISAWIYLYNRSAAALTRIQPGDYLDWLARRPGPSDDK